jgi:excisionase family DNA binding protein
METNQLLVSREQAAEFLGVRPQTLAAWASSRRYALPFVKVGRRVMYRLSDLDAFIERNVFGGEVQQ